MSDARAVLTELGFYTLAGQPASSRDLVAEVIEAEALGLGTAFISERYNKKEAATLSGAAGAVTDRITIETAATNHNTRHPMVTAGYARTMQSLTGGRFVLGLGRGIPMMQDAFGIGRITTAQILNKLHPTEASRREFIERNIPMGRFGEPHEAAAVIAFLVSEAASYITGVTIPMDWGALRFSL